MTWLVTELRVLESKPRLARMTTGGFSTAHPSPCAMHILDLPNEVLGLIAGYLDSLADVSALIRVHSQFWHLLDKQLYHRARTSKAIRQPLSWAAHNDIPCTVQKVIDYGLKLNVRLPDGNTALGIACRANSREVVKLLLASGKVKASLKMKGSAAPLHVAAYYNHIEIVRLLLDYNYNTSAHRPWGDEPAQPVIDVNNADGNRRTALMVASDKGYADVVAELLTAPGIDTQCEERGGWTPLIQACFKKRVKVIETLLASDKVDPNARNTCGWTALTKAISERRRVSVQALLSSDRIDVTRPASRLSLLHHPFERACWVGEERLALVLLEAANQAPWPQDLRGVTLWHCAAASASTPNVISALVARNEAHVNRLHQTYGRAPLHISVERGEAESVRRLLQAKEIDVNVRDSRGYTPLHLACDYMMVGSGTRSKLKERRLIMKMLLEAPGTELGAYTADGEAPIHILSQVGYTAGVRLLVNGHDVDPNSAMEKSSITPLYLAAKQGHVPLFRFLLRHPRFDEHRSIGQCREILDEAGKRKDCPELQRFVQAYNGT